MELGNLRADPPWMQCSTTHALRVCPCVRASWGKSEISLGLMSSLISKNVTPIYRDKTTVCFCLRKGTIHCLLKRNKHYGTHTASNLSAKSLEYEVIWWKPCITWSQSMPWEMWALRHKNPLCFLSILCCSFGNAKVQPLWDSWGSRPSTQWGKPEQETIE